MTSVVVSVSFHCTELNLSQTRALPPPLLLLLRWKSATLDWTGVWLAGLWTL